MTTINAAPESRYAGKLPHTVPYLLALGTVLAIWARAPREVGNRVV